MDGRGGRPEEYCHRSMLDALRYLTDNGGKWRSLPEPFPPPRKVFDFFRRWVRQGVFAQIHTVLVKEIRRRAGRSEQPAAAVIDAQSLKAAETVGSASRGFDGGKQVNGRKRHIVVDTLGLVLLVAVTAADVNDRTAAMALFARLALLFRQVTKVWADHGYDGELVPWTLRTLGIDLEIPEHPGRRKGHGFKVIAKRWIVERTLAWITRRRRCVRDYERRTDHHAAFVLLAVGINMSRRLAGPADAAARKVSRAAWCTSRHPASRSTPAPRGGNTHPVPAADAPDSTPSPAARPPAGPAPAPEPPARRPAPPDTPPRARPLPDPAPTRAPAHPPPAPSPPPWHLPPGPARTRPHRRLPPHP
ncbi:IS5 family transposase [Streptomyces sp. NBC_01264]|nr:IS5 family transposase [Streptomyces sp. NBC_01264]MCX4775348.1 IS5 family transposase [Streptomyces sp. NBC_01264]MCX4781668.1 IS5 family transposase [Streptomyces sp. NBC_01264]